MGGADRVPGPAPVMLDDHPRVGGVRAEMADHLVAAVAHHDDEFCRVQLAGCCQHVIQHAPAANPVQHFREGRPHPRARARGKNDDGGRTAHTHVAALLGCCSPVDRAPLSPFASDTSQCVGNPVHIPDPGRIPPGQKSGTAPPAVAQRHQLASPDQPGGA